MPKIQHYIGKINMRSGEYDFDSTFRFKTGGDPERYLDKLAKKWYDGPCDREDDGYSFHFGCIFVRGGSFQTIAEDVYRQLDPILVEM